MKNLLYIIYFFIFLLTATVGVDVTPNNDIEKKLLDIFEKWRNDDKSSLPLSLPTLNVLYIPPLSGSYTGKGVRLSYYASRMKVVGMNYFTVAKLNVSLIDMSASGILTVPMLDVSADEYKVEGHALYIYSLRGSGKLHAIFKNIKLVFAIKLTGNGTHTNIDEFNLNFAIGGIQVYLENSSWPINKVLNREGVKIIEGYREDIVTATEKNLISRLDTYLITVSPEQLLNIMQKV